MTWRLCTRQTFLILWVTAAFADQITLTNGDRITGKVVKKDGDSLVVKADMLGDVSIKLANISTLHTDAPLTVVLPQDVTVNGTVTIDGNRVQVTTPSGRQEAPLPTVQ